MITIHHLLAQIAGSLLTIRPADDIEAVVVHSLKLMGDFVGADRAYLFLVNRSEGTISNSHEWCDQGIAQEKDNLQDVPLEVFPWFLKKVLADGILDIPDMDALPAEAAVEQELLQAQGIKSLLAASIADQEGLVGFVGFDAVLAKRNWDVEHAELLGIMGKILKVAIDRHSELVTLKKVQERLLAIFEEGRDAVLISDKRGSFRFANRAAADLTGYSVAELLQMKFNDLNDNPDGLAVGSFLKRILSGEKIFLDAPLKREDGTRCSVEFSSTRIQLEGEYYVHTSIRDITERVHYTDSLQFSEKLLRAIVRNFQTLILQSTSQLLEKAVGAFGESLGASACFISVRHLESRSKQSFKPTQVWVKYSQSMDQEIPKCEEFSRALSEFPAWKRRIEAGLPIQWSRTRGGGEENTLLQNLLALNILPVTVRGELWGALCFLFKERGEGAEAVEMEAMRLASLFVGTAVELRSQQQRLSESEERYRGIFSQAYDAIFLVDEHCHIWDANERGFAILQCSKFDLLTKTVSDFCTPRALAQLRVARNELHERGSISFSTEIKGLEGNVLPVEVSAKRVLDSPGTYQCVVRDISIHRQMQQYLLEQIEAERTRFGQEMHDGVCQDLKSLDIQIQILLNQIETSAPAQIDFVKSLGGTCNNLVRQAYRVAQGLLPPAVGIRSTRETLFCLLEESKSIYNCAIVLEGFDGIPDLGKRGVAHVYRIIQEAIKNAIFHGSATEIRVVVATTGKLLSVKIVDNGTGMKDTPEPSHIGGMGIAVMRSRAASVGGFLDVMGTPGTGFTVEIVVPLPIEET